MLFKSEILFLKRNAFLSESLLKAEIHKGISGGDRGKIHTDPENHEERQYDLPFISLPDDHIVGDRQAQDNRYQQEGPVDSQIFEKVPPVYGNSASEKREKAREVGRQILQIRDRENDPCQGNQDDHVEMADDGETLYKPFDHEFFPDNDQTES